MSILPQMDDSFKIGLMPPGGSWKNRQSIQYHPVLSIKPAPGYTDTYLVSLYGLPDPVLMHADGLSANSPLWRRYLKEA